MERTIDMTSGNPARLILKFALPLIVTNIGQQLYMIVDGIIVGRGVGVDGLAAVGATDWIYWMILWSVMVMTQGFATFISRYYGEKNFEKINKTIAMSALLTAAVGAMVTVLGILTARPLLELLKTPENIIDGATVYLVTLIAGALAIAAYNLSSAILRAFGDGRSPFVAMVIAAILNVGLDLLFVLVFGWGIFGAAIASVLSQGASFVYCYVKIRKLEFVKLDKNAFRPDFHLLAELFKFGMSLALQYVVISLSGVVLQSTINLWGSNFIAGYTATNKVYGLLECTAIALGASCSTYFAQNYGAKNHERVRRGVKTGAVIVTLTSLAVTAVSLLVGRYLLMMFLDVNAEGGREAFEVALKYLNAMALSLSILYLIYVFRQVLQAMGNSTWSLISGFGEFGARVFMAKVVVKWIGENTLYAVEPVAWVAALLFVMVPYLVYFRKKLKE